MRLGFLLFIALAASLAMSQDRFPDVPAAPKKGQSVQALIDDLIRRAVMPSQEAMGHRTSGGNRYEQAVFIYAAYQTLIQPKVKHRLGAEFPDVVRNVRRATSGLEKELASMGVDVEGMKLHLRALALGEGFPDVPPKHWASKATLELKELGLLKGYPDGLFRGD